MWYQVIYAKDRNISTVGKYTSDQIHYILTYWKKNKNYITIILYERKENENNNKIKCNKNFLIYEN